jgi:hypothetical protein
MLQRVYGTVWETPEQLRQYLLRLEELRKRDHRRIGEDLDLFTFSEEVGRGLPLWLPKGTVIREELGDWAKETERLPAGREPSSCERGALPDLRASPLLQGRSLRAIGHRGRRVLPETDELSASPHDLQGATA